MSGNESIWKKEIQLPKLRRSKAAPVVEAVPVVEAEPVLLADTPTAVPELELVAEPEMTPAEPWVFPSAPSPEPELVAEPEPVVAAESPTESWLPRYEPLPADISGPFAESAPEPEPVFEVEPEPEPEPVAEIEPELEPVAEIEPELAPVVEFEPSPAPQESKPSTSRFSLPKLSLPGLPKPSLRPHHVERVVGLKIGGSQIVAACVTNNGSARLERVARTPLADGIVSGGELRDVQALADALRTFFDAYKLPKRGVRLGVASSRIGVRSFEIPAIDDEKQFVNAVRFRAQEALPIPLDEAVLDYRVLSEREGEDGTLVRRVLLVVAHRDLVERYVEACKLAGLTLAGIDLEAFALLRALAAPADREESALVAVSIGHDRTTLAVSDGRVCEFTRVLEWGGGVLNTALAKALNTTPDEVERVKRSLSLAGGPAPEGLTPEEATAAVDAVRRAFEALARELVSSLTYYQSQPDSLGIGEIVVTGGTARLDGLADELGRLLGVPVRIGDPLDRIELMHPVAEEDRGSLAIAIGLGIED